MIKAPVTAILQSPYSWSSKKSGKTFWSFKFLVSDSAGGYVVEASSEDEKKVHEFSKTVKVGSEFFSPIDNRISFVGGLNQVRVRLA